LTKNLIAFSPDKLRLLCSGNVSSWPGAESHLTEAAEGIATVLALCAATGRF
jgi:hypothetical protein